MKSKKHFEKNIKGIQSIFKIPHIVVMLFLTFFIFTFIGAGSIIVVIFGSA